MIGSYLISLMLAVFVFLLPVRMARRTRILLSAAAFIVPAALFTLLFVTAPEEALQSQDIPRNEATRY